MDFAEKIVLNDTPDPDITEPKAPSKMHTPPPNKKGKQPPPPS
jgi:hypothetical protein